MSIEAGLERYEKVNDMIKAELRKRVRQLLKM